MGKAKDSFDESSAERYRRNDEQAIQFGSRKHYCETLGKITTSFEQDADVLDVGCGTGRYFHCLRQASRITGIDLSPNMLAQAKNPVKQSEIDVGAIQLLCGDVYSPDLEQESFDFIYSIGVFAEYAPVDKDLLSRFHSLLRPGGCLFFTAVDIRSRIQPPEGGSTKLSYKVIRKLFRHLPGPVRLQVNKALKTLFLGEQDLKNMMGSSAFDSYEISRYRHPSDSGWQGTHLDCIAHKKTEG